MEERKNKVNVGGEQNEKMLSNPPLRKVGSWPLQVLRPLPSTLEAPGGAGLPNTRI